MSKIAVCSLAIGEEYKKSVALCTETLRQYCAKHNYTLITDESAKIEDRDLMWSKIPLIRHTLPNYDYVVWIDGDMMIMNDECKLERYIDLYMGARDTMMATDCGDKINTGFWVLRNCQYNMDLLHLIENLPELAGDYHEQGVFGELYKKNLHNLQEHSRIIPEVEQRVFNSALCNYVQGDFLLHFLGIRRPSVINFLSNQHYPKLMSGESQESYENRLTFLKEKYEKVQNPRYIESPPKVTIGVCTFFTGEKYSDSVVKWGQKSMNDYCRKNKYDFLVQRKTLVDDLPAHWTKLALLLKICRETNYDYVVWFDADIMITNHEITVESIIEEYMKGKDFLLSNDISEEINTGVWIVRNTDYTRKILELTLSLPELRYRGYEDQDTFNQVYNRNLLKLKEHASILPTHLQHVMNCCVGLYKKGCWLIHFFGLSKNGVQKSFNDFYPFQKDDEPDNVYSHRMNWLNNFNSHI